LPVPALGNCIQEADNNVARIMNRFFIP